MLESSIFILLTVVAIIIDAIVIFILTKKRTSSAKILTCAGVCAIFLQSFYALSLLAKTEHVASLFSSLHYVFIDLSLIFTLVFVLLFTKQENYMQFFCTLIVISSVLVCLDSIAIICNVKFIPDFLGSYVQNKNGYPYYVFNPNSRFNFHTVLVYSLVLIPLCQLFYKAYKTPITYRKKYIVPAVSILSTALLNVVISIVFVKFNENNLDYSVLLYSVILYFFYRYCFFYQNHGMQVVLNNLIMTSVDQGFFLFDYEDKLTAVTSQMKKLFPNMDLNVGLDFKTFLRLANLRIPYDQKSETNFSLIHTVPGIETNTIRCEGKKLYNKKNVFVGRVITVTEIQDKKDILTGFTTWKTFKDSVPMLEIPSKNCYAVVCDINNLREMNEKKGLKFGDTAIKQLALLLRKYFPNTLYYVRGIDSYLFLIVENTDEQEIINALSNLTQEILFNDTIKFSYQSGISIIDGKDDILYAIDRAIHSMREKKLLDKSSAHSQLINSLIAALHESSVDTKDHVSRTQLLGSQLGKRLNITDVQQSELSLLCLLHDIGKIAIPLDILNKPNRLSDKEWEIMQSHVDKGYQIAKSSNELKCVAEMIRSHHERWDGKGYPDGLSKETIPLLSRIISIVDAYDAMTNDRPYRKAIPKSKAREELRRCAGTQFDPNIVQEFLTMLSEMESEQDETTNYEFNENSFARPKGVNDVTSVPTKNYIRKVNYTRYILNAENVVVSVDDNFEELTGYSKEEIKNNKITQFDLLFDDDAEILYNMVMKSLENHTHAYFEHRIRTKNGSPLYVFSLTKRYMNENGELDRYELLLTNMSDTYIATTFMDSEKEKADNRLKAWETKYRCDSLTGLLTHEAFTNDVDAKLLNSDTQMIFMMMDLDGFKQYNDTYGHYEGDKYLILVADTINSAIGKNALVCRIGGDEFAAAFYIDKNEDLEKAYTRARNVCNTVNQVLQTAQGNSTLSMGAVHSSSEINTCDKLYELADKALYKAKSLGKCRMVKYSEITEK